MSVCTDLYQCIDRLVLCLYAQARLAEAVKVKVSGNEAFKLGHFSEAMEYYTQGLELCPLKYVQQRSIMFSNRAACRMKEVGFAKEKNNVNLCYLFISLAALNGTISQHTRWQHPCKIVTQTVKQHCWYTTLVNIQKCTA